jgi:NitT/TauT family transport system ATP-binding protein
MRIFTSGDHPLAGEEIALRQPTSTPRRQPEEATGREPAIHATGITVEYRLPRKGSVTALDDFSLSVGRGEFVALIGPSGCGKSTFLRVLAALETPTRGEVRLNGESPVHLVSEHRLGVAFQDHGLLPWLSVRQNLRIPFRIARQKPDESRIDYLIELVGLTKFADARPSHLSGGMRQRVSIARALALHPQILLLDEPFGALDLVTRRHLNAELQRIWQEEAVTTLLVTHSVEEAAFLADRVVVMTGRPGRIREQRDLSYDRPRDIATMKSLAFHRDVDALTESLDEAVAK